MNAMGVLSPPGHERDCFTSLSSCTMVVLITPMDTCVLDTRIPVSTRMVSGSEYSYVHQVTENTTERLRIFDPTALVVFPSPGVHTSTWIDMHLMSIHGVE